MNTTKKLGYWGEEAAQTYLKQKGYHILAVNWRFSHLEIDIIAKDKDELVFVEVKTRSNNAFGEPEEAVSLSKQRKLIKAAHHYILQNELDLNSRFDILAIYKENNTLIVKHLESAFFPLIN
jgi:putative endonuclease